MDEVFSAEVWSQGTGIVSLLDPRSSLLADPGYRERQRNSTSEGLFRYCSDLFLKLLPLFPSAPRGCWQWGRCCGCPVQMAGVEHCLSQCQWVQWPSLCWPEQPGLGADSAQPCAMLPDDSLQLASHSLGNTEGSWGADQHPADSFSMHKLPLPSEPMSLLKGSMENLSE